jgi:hypothetical protein
VSGMAGAPVQEVSSSGESFDPVGEWHVSMNKKATYTIVQSANDAFGLSILSRCIWTG